MKRIALWLALALAPLAAQAQTANQVTPGYMSTACPGVGPCFVPYGSGVPTKTGTQTIVPLDVSTVTAGGTNGAATSVNITGGQIGSVFGDIGNQSYGVLADSGVTRVTINGVDFSNCVTGSIDDATGGAGNVMWRGCIDINGVQLPDRLPVLPADTSLAYNGLMYYDAAAGTFRVYQGGALHTISVI